MVRSLMLIALLASASASAEVYRWVDKNGVINYSDTPPKSVAAKKVDQDQISIVPLAPLVRASSLAASNQALRQRVERLEEEADRERGIAPMSYPSLSQIPKEWREQCYDDRRVDCDDPRTYYGYGGSVYGYGYYPPVVVGAARRSLVPIVRPRPPVPVQTGPTAGWGVKGASPSR